MNKGLSKIRQAHFEFLKNLGIFDYRKLPASKKYQNNMPEFASSVKTPLSNSIERGGFKDSIDDYKWKRDREESAETIKEIENKKKRIAPAYSKGATQYITPEADVKDLGKKV